VKSSRLKGKIAFKSTTFLFCKKLKIILGTRRLHHIYQEGREEEKYKSTKDINGILIHDIPPYEHNLIKDCVEYDNYSILL